MTILIEAGERQVLFEAVISELSAVGDLAIEVESDRIPEAKLMRRRFEVGMRLLDDLGWREGDGRDRYELTVPVEELAPLIERFHEQALEELQHRANGATEDEAGTVFEHVRALRSYRAVLVRALEKAGEGTAYEIA